MRRTKTGTQAWRSGEVLPRPQAPGSTRTDRDGSDGTRPLVRTSAFGAELRAVDGRSGANQSLPCAEAEDRPAGCGSHSEADDGRSFSPGMGTESGESGSPSTALASSSAGAKC